MYLYFLIRTRTCVYERVQYVNVQDFRCKQFLNEPLVYRPENLSVHELCYIFIFEIFFPATVF